MEPTVREIMLEYEIDALRRQLEAELEGAKWDARRAAAENMELRAQLTAERERATVAERELLDKRDTIRDLSEMVAQQQREAGDWRDNYKDAVKERDAARAKLAESEAACAAMRAVFDRKVHGNCKDLPHWIGCPRNYGNRECQEARKALAPDAGRAMLAEVERLRDEVEEKWHQVNVYRARADEATAEKERFSRLLDQAYERYDKMAGERFFTALDVYRTEADRDRLWWSAWAMLGAAMATIHEMGGESERYWRNFYQADGSLDLAEAHAARADAAEDRARVLTEALREITHKAWSDLVLPFVSADLTAEGATAVSEAAKLVVGLIQDIALRALASTEVEP